MKIFLLAFTLSAALLNHAFALSDGGSKKHTIITQICKEDEAYFQDLPSYEYANLGKTYEAKDVVISLHLYLGPDRTYYAIYNELIVEKKPDGEYFKGSYSGIFEKRFRGKYQITPEETVVLENLGVGTNEAGANGLLLMNFKFTHPVNDLGAVGKVIQIKMFDIYGRCLKK